MTGVPATSGNNLFSGGRGIRWFSFALMAISLFMIAGVITFKARGGGDPSHLLQHIVAGTYRFLGFSGAIFGFLLILLWSARSFLAGNLPRLKIKILGVIGVVLSVSGLSGSVSYDPGTNNVLLLDTCGWLGSVLASRMVPMFSLPGSVALFALIMVGSFLLATNWLFIEEFKGLGDLKRGKQTKPVTFKETAVSGEESEYPLFRKPQSLESVTMDEVSPAEEEALITISRPQFPSAAELAGEVTDDEPEPAATTQEMTAEKLVQLIAPVDDDPFLAREEEEESDSFVVASEAPTEEESAEEEPAEEETGDDAEADVEAFAPEKGQSLFCQEEDSTPAPEAEAKGTDEEITDDGQVQVSEEAVIEKIEAGVSEQEKELKPEEGKTTEEPKVEIPRPDSVEEAPAAVEVELSPDAEPELDPILLDQAAVLVIDTGRASLTMLQRKLKIRFGLASRIMDKLEGLGVVGSYRGSLPREILMASEQWENSRIPDHTNT